MSKSWRSDWPQWLILAAMFVAGAAAWPRVPDRVPVHWDLNGEVDRYGGRFEGLMMLPLLALGMYFLFRVLPRFDPRAANYAQFVGPYTTIRVATLLVLAVLHGVVLLAATGRPVDVSRVVPPLIGVLFIVIGGLMGKLRQSWFVGIRTPWTLSSARAWGKTHRLGGWIFIAAGLVMVGGGLIGLPYLAFGGVVGLVVAIVGLAAYSYVIWRQDQGAAPPSGPRPAGEI